MLFIFEKTLVIMASEVYKTYDFLALNTVTGLRSPRRQSDAVRLAELENLANELRQELETLANELRREIATHSSISKVIVDLVDGLVDADDTVFNIKHNLGSTDVIEKVYNKETGETVNAEFIRFMNECNVVFRNNSSVRPSLYRLLIIKLA